MRWLITGLRKNTQDNAVSIINDKENVNNEAEAVKVNK